MIAVRLPEDIIKRLDALAKATGRTKTFYVREAILCHIGELEKLYLKEQELINIRAGKSKRSTTEDVEQREQR